MSLTVLFWVNMVLTLCRLSARLNILYPKYPCYMSHQFDYLYTTDKHGLFLACHGHCTSLMCAWLNVCQPELTLHGSLYYLKMDFHKIWMKGCTMSLKWYVIQFCVLSSYEQIWYKIKIFKLKPIARKCGKKSIGTLHF